MTKTRERRKHTSEDFEPDQRVVAVEGFRPWIGPVVERGRYFRLSDPVVRQNPQFFAVVVPVTDVLAGEIERGGE
jgi:hypothetical protein